MREVPFADPDVDEIPAFLRPKQAPPPQDPGPPVTLPPSGSGERARRRRHQRRSALRRRTLVTFLVVITLAATVLVERPWQDTTSSPSRAQPPAAPHLAPLPASSVIVQQDAQGAAASITLLVADPSGHGGRVVFVPPATMTEVPSFGLD